MSFDRSLFIGKFTQEAKEHIQKLNHRLIELEKDPENPEIIKDIMHVVHTLKGSSKLMRFNNVSLLSHKMEDLLARIQKGHLKVTESIIDLCFKSTDVIGQCIESILKGQGDALDIAPVCETLELATKGEDISATVSQFHIEESSASSAILSPSPSPSLEEHKEKPGIENIPPTSAFRVKPESTKALHAGDDTKRTPILSPEKTDSTLKTVDTIRVGIDNLDNAIRLVGEIAVSHRKANHTLSVLRELQQVTRNHVKQTQQLFQNGSQNSEQVKKQFMNEGFQILKGIETLCKEQRDENAFMEIVIGELHEDVLKMRMLPLSTIFDAFPRAVRDMAKSFQKKIELRITGEETTLDKKIIEKLNAPLIHILRNCVDHGIELPEERIAQKKPPTGIISINAYHKGGAIEIQITDDGRGVPTEKLRQRLIELGFVTEDKAHALKETELVNMIFLPGVSTSAIITDISGRGLGMDIVKAHIEQLKGTIAFSSKAGHGTTCILTLPVTLTTLRCLIISSQKALFAIPITAIEQTLLVPSHEFIEVVGRKAIRQRNQIIYVVDLADVLQLPRKNMDASEQHFILIAKVGGKRIGLIVDEILDEQDIVVKQLPHHMQKVKTIAGATISSDNMIILILHLPEIMELLKLTTMEARDDKYPRNKLVPPRILLVEDSINTGEIEKSILEAYGYQVDLAQDGIDALEQLEQTDYNLVITDIEMPRMDGFSLTEHLRKTAKYADIPIIVVTSLERESDKRRSIRLGANAYIMKSTFEQQHFIETVGTLIQHMGN